MIGITHVYIPGVTSPNNYRRVFLLRFMRFSPYWKDSQLMRSSWKDRHARMQCINNGSYVGNDYDILWGSCFWFWQTNEPRERQNAILWILWFNTWRLLLLLLLLCIIHARVWKCMLGCYLWNIACALKKSSNIWTWVSMDSGLPDSKTNPKIPSNT